MRRPAAWIGKIVAAVILLAAPFAIHLAIVSGKWTIVVVMISLLQLLAIGAAAFARAASRRKRVVTALAVMVLAPLYVEAARLNAAGLSGIPHAIAYSTLLIGFGISLLPGHEPVLTRVALRLRGPLPAALLLHTRRVTLAWCIFFGAQLVVSAVLFAWAPIVVWSLFVNVLNLPLVVLMFAVEYGYRVARFRGFRHDRISDIVRFLREVTQGAARQPDPT